LAGSAKCPWEVSCMYLLGKVCRDLNHLEKQVMDKRLANVSTLLKGE